MTKVDSDAILSAATDSTTPTIEEDASAPTEDKPGRKVWECSMDEDCAYRVHQGKGGKTFDATSDHQVWSRYFHRMMPALYNFAVGPKTSPVELEAEVICVHCLAKLIERSKADGAHGEMRGQVVVIRYDGRDPIQLQPLGKTIGWLVSEQDKRDAANDALDARLGQKLAEGGARGRGRRGSRRSRPASKPATPAKPAQRDLADVIAEERSAEAPAPTTAPVGALDQLVELAVQPESDGTGDEATPTA